MGIWGKAFQLALEQKDPWVARGIHVLPAHHCIRHRYNPKTHTWVVDDGEPALVLTSNAHNACVG